MYVYLFVGIYIYIYIYIYRTFGTRFYMYVCISFCRYIYIYINTHIRQAMGGLPQAVALDGSFDRATEDNG